MKRQGMRVVQLMTNAQKGVGQQGPVRQNGFCEGWMFDFPNGVTVWRGSTERREIHGIVKEVWARF